MGTGGVARIAVCAGGGRGAGSVIAFQHRLVVACQQPIDVGVGAETAIHPPAGLAALGSAEREQLFGAFHHGLKQLGSMGIADVQPRAQGFTIRTNAQARHLPAGLVFLPVK